MFINIFKYKIVRAKIKKILYKREYIINLRRYEKDEVFDRQSSLGCQYSIFDYDKTDMWGDRYREYPVRQYDYRLLVEYVFNNKIYKNKVTINQISKHLNKKSRVNVYFDRKNPDNVFPILSFIDRH